MYGLVNQIVLKSFVLFNRSNCHLMEISFTQVKFWQYCSKIQMVVKLFLIFICFVFIMKRNQLLARVIKCIEITKRFLSFNVQLQVLLFINVLKKYKMSILFCIESYCAQLPYIINSLMFPQDLFCLTEIMKIFKIQRKI